MTEEELIEEIAFIIDPGAFTEMDCRAGAQRRRSLTEEHQVMKKKWRRTHATKRAKEVMRIMIPYLQLVKHDPDNGSFGDCYRACIASLLEVPVEEVPHFVQLAAGEPDETHKLANRWLEYRGYTLLHMPTTSHIDMIHLHMRQSNPGIYYIITGLSPRGATHCCIFKDGQLAHDPAASGGGIVAPCEDDGIYFLTFILPRFMKAGK